VLRKRGKHPLDPLVLRHRGIAWCKLLPLKFLRRALSKGDGFSGLHCSRVILYPLLLGKMAKGRVLHNPFVRPAPTIALIEGI